MDENERSFETLVARTTDFGKASLALIKLRAVEKASEVVSTMVPILIMVVLLAAGTIFLSIGLAIWLGFILDNSIWGFVIVGSIYAWLALCFAILMRKWLKTRISNFIINKFLT